ncbi:MAG: glutamate--cysteine ligase [Gammaproteobacteria bacterium]|nr:glutamate--cysteine ligase [Gammaproteobacteria bacterium]NND40270.1 glutamate--cysteine ligase [Pseudomonadales bacterium]
MGQEISETRFSEKDFSEFAERLRLETEHLREKIAGGELEAGAPSAGCELEAWLVDALGQPAPVNGQLLKSLNHPDVVPELSTFNVELNTAPQKLASGSLEKLHAQLTRLWQHCEREANKLGAHMLMTGILPTVRQSDLCLENISSMHRFLALNEQIFKLRGGVPIELDIEGAEHLTLSHHDLMLEAATTSFQIHYKVAPQDAVRAFNASKILSAPLVAIAANSPYLFGYDLWEETRIPLFEQAVAVGGSPYSRRVTFGVRYARDSIMEVFDANREFYPVLLPELMDTPLDECAHLRLHNGTIWRWNRPLLGFSPNGDAHLRIEQRVAPAGPTLSDMLANTAFYYGALTALLDPGDPVEQRLPFEQAAKNFYACSRYGLQANVVWFDGARSRMQELVVQELLPLASRGLEQLGYSAEDAGHWLGIVRERVLSGRTGSRWQRSWIARHGRNFGELVTRYRELQASDIPIHEWPAP